VDAALFSPDIRVARRPAARARLGVDGLRVLLLVGNDIHGKGVDTAVAALALLPSDVVLAVAGDVEPGVIRTWARRTGVTDRVLAWPHIPDVIESYAAADVLVAPSREDSFHLPTLEALACGLPAVVSSATGVAELLEDRRHALILRDPDDHRELASAIRSALHDPHRMAAEGRRLAETLTWGTSADHAGDVLEREARIPRALVLGPDPGGVGGIQRATRTLIRAAADLLGPERVGLLALRSGERSEALPCRLLRRGRRPEGSRIGIWERAGYAVAVARTARRWRDRLAVLCAHPHLAPVGLLARFITGAPYAVWCHGEEVWGPIRPAVRWSLRRADVVFAPSRFTARQVEARARLRPDSVRVLPHALSPEAAPAANASRRHRQRVVTVARLDPAHTYKGVDTLLVAWAKVIADRPGAELTVVGDGPDRYRLEGLAVDLGLNGSVTFAGAVSDGVLTDLYGSATVFALPSRLRVGPGAEGEGFGLAFLEAAAAGLPVVAGRGGAVDEVVVDGETGLLVDARDVNEVAGAVERLLAEPHTAARLGNAGRRRVETEFSFERFRARLGRLIGDMVRTPLTTNDGAMRGRGSSCASC
jgi:phosphatidylinositol alpha-1,6-mannosyltransferase